jgi:hypothetical protein
MRKRATFFQIKANAQSGHYLSPILRLKSVYCVDVIIHALRL